MNLDNLDQMRQLDHQDMLAQIRGLPEQLSYAWQLGSGFSLPDYRDIRIVVVAGMGGSAIGADLLAHYVAPFCTVPVFVYRDYDLPAWASGEQTLVIASSHSGNTEETLSAFQAAKKQVCRQLCICTNGRLAEMASRNNVPAWIFNHHGQPRSAVGFSFGLLLAALHKLSMVPNLEADLNEAVKIMRVQQEQIGVEIPTTKNPAKRQAGQLFGRWVSILGSGYLAPVARRWKSQISELAKAWAQFEFLPEADHNTLAGAVNPVDVLTRTVTLFLRAPSDHPRNALRATLTQQGFMIAGMNTDYYEAKGSSPLAHIWSALHFGDYVAYYLAMAYGVDPTPVDALEELKSALRN